MEKKIIKMLGEHFCKGNNITENTVCKIEYIDAKSLIVPNRLDIIAKYLYIYNYVEHINSKFLIDLYDKHIEAFTHGTCAEPGNQNKNTLMEYHKTFNELIDTIQKKGFDENESIVPVGDNNCILDGAHRVACCLYFHKKVKIVRFNGIEFKFNYEYFKNEYLEIKYLDYMVLAYGYLKKNIYVANIWPAASDLKKRSQIDDILGGIGNIICKKKVTLTYEGYRNYMLQIYSKHDWVGSFENHFKGVMSKVDACYKANMPLSIYTFECESLSEVLEIKEKIRRLFEIDNHSIHISDNQIESLQMLQLLLNSNSVELMNYCRPDSTRIISQIIQEYNKKYSEQIYLCSYDSVVIGNVILSLYGNEKYEEYSILRLNVQNDEYNLKSSQVNEIIINPESFVFFFGVKFVSIRMISEFLNGDAQTLTDKVQTIKQSFGKTEKLSMAQKIKRNVNIEMRKAKGKIIMFSRRLHIYDMLRFIYRKIKR